MTATLPPHALVVGGTRGIGLAVTRAFLAAGHRVTALARRPCEDPAFGPGGATFLAADLSDPEAAGRALDGLLAATGAPDATVFLQRRRGPGEDWEAEFTLALAATRVLLDRIGAAAAPDRDRGVVLVGSSAGRQVAPEQDLPYHLAKAALEQMDRFYAVRLGPRGLRVNAVALGTVLKQESRSFYEGQPELAGLYAGLSPLGRMGTAEEVARAILFLCGPGASWITGQTLAVDGGASLLTAEALARRSSPLRDLSVTRPDPRD